MKAFLAVLFLSSFYISFAQSNAKAPEQGAPELQVDFVDGVLLFQTSQACLQAPCNANVELLKEAITHIILRKADKKEINSWMPIKVGGTIFYLTAYHYPFDAARADTILHLENDSIIIHDVGADGLLTDSTREYCINKKTQKRLDWNSNYAALIQAGLCPIACFMRSLHDHGYNGYFLQLMKDGHTGISFY